jgi:hypothetical protein
MKSDALAQSTRVFFKSEAGREVLQRLAIKRVGLLTDAANSPKDEAYELLKEAKGIQTAVSEIKVIMSLDKSKKGGK